ISLFLPDDEILLCSDAVVLSGFSRQLPEYSNPDLLRATLERISSLNPRLLLSGRFQPLPRERWEPAFEENRKLIDIIETFLLRSIERSAAGVDLAELAGAVCARFSRPLTASACRTIESHLMTLQSKGKIHLEGGRWRFGGGELLQIVRTKRG
ncbi:MAG: hypothetical protein D6743_14060, partial [Calditrichaeota bacterium]